VTDRFPYFQRARVLVAIAALAALSACAQEEYALLLDVHARTDIGSIAVQVIPRDGSTATARVAQTITRDAATIAADTPIRIAVSFAGPVDVVVHVRGDGPDGALIATRCYSINGVVRDSALLVALDASADADSDGFPAQGAVSCLDPSGATASQACDYACAGGIGVDCRGCIGSECPAAPADGDPHIYPGADEICADGIDQNCDGADAECGDLDGDGYQACSVINTGACDCADTDPTRNPGAVEICGDGIDQNCDGVDTLCDRDGDGFPSDLAVGGTPDCDDTDANVHPDVTGEPTMEVCTPDGGVARDENCNGLMDELPSCASNDLDADGAEDCTLVGGATGCDCNDCDPSIGPRVTEICGNGIDENCDGVDTACGANDADHDGEIAAASGGTDCNDTPPDGARIGTWAIELCGNGVDENCDGMDTPCSPATDPDGDGYAEPTGCEGDAAIVPWSQELCDGVDDNCNGHLDEANPAGPTPYDACIIARAGETGCVNDRCAVQYATSFFHCGGCRRACNFLTTDLCAGGTCQCTSGTGTVPECTGGSTCCPAAGCHDLQTDLNFCGNCGNDCSALYGTRVDSCAGGLCACGSGGICVEGETCCGGTCVDLRADATNCGTCGNVCTLPFATSICSTAVCAIETCSANRADCDTLAVSGCEIDLSLAESCGACGVTCSTNGACAATGGAYACTCNTGYAGTGVTCSDVNECTAGAPCGANSTCTNTAGSYTCACVTGFTSPDGRACTDIDECAAATACGRNLSATNTCGNTPGGYTCSCAAGFSASGSGATASCIDVNECTPATACGRDLTPANLCTNSVGSYSCSCTAGYAPAGSGLTATCANTNECTTAGQCGRSLVGGGVNSCADTTGSYTCTCGAGFVLSGTGLTATCVNVNECSTAGQCGRSLGGGGVNSCADTSGGYTCTCGAGFVLSGTGLSATCVNVNECATAGQCGRTLVGGGLNGCADTSGGYTCSCGAGFVLSGTGLSATCVDVDECVAATACGRNLSASNTCANSSGGYTCACTTGFAASGSGLTATCVDTNECTAPTACGRDLSASNTCANTVGGYTCACAAGFAASGSGATATCADVDECLAPATCGTARLTCTNTNGSYQCTCDPGYSAPASAGTCADVNECAAATACGRNLSATNTCANSVGGYACTCDTPGFAASGAGFTATCVDVNECLSGTPCGTGGTCTNSAGSYSCVCGPAVLNCGGPSDCETPRSDTDCGACGAGCSGGTPRCCLVGSTYQCSTNSTC
jgi:hypothetical protein